MKKPMFQDCSDCRNYIDCCNADTPDSSGCDRFVPELNENEDLSEFREMPDDFETIRDNERENGF